MGIYYEYDSMAPKKRQKLQNLQKKNNKTKRVGLGGWGLGVANRWVRCGYVSYGCGNDNVVLKHYCYYLLNHLSNKKSERTSITCLYSIFC